MEDEATKLLSALKKPSTQVDTRLALFNSLKSGIKHNRVPDTAQATIFECIRIAISASTSAALVSTGFSTLSHFIKRLVLQRETTILTSNSHNLLALLLDRLGDARESHRNAAAQILGDLYPLLQTQVEELMRDSAMKGANPRAKDVSMQWLVKVRYGMLHQESGSF
jgi:CLIP-associating protein 1/2